MHEEISRHGNLSGQAVLSPLVGVENHHGNKESCCLEDHYDNSEPSISRSHGNLTLEDLEHIAQNSVCGIYTLYRAYHVLFLFRAINFIQRRKLL